MFLSKKNKIRVIILVTVSLLFLGFVLGLKNVRAQETKSQLLDISAYILNQENKEVQNGKYKIRFAIYDSESGSSSVWEEEQEIEITNGLFEAYLGSANSLPKDVNLAQGNYYLGIKVGDDSESVPRKKIGYVPAALSAVNSTFVNGATTGNEEGNILQLGKGGKIDLDRLPTGTDENSLVLGNDDRLHEANTDTATDATEFNLGSGTGNNNNFSLTVSNASNKPALRFNGLSQKWQFSSDGVAFEDFSLGADFQSQIEQRSLIGHTHIASDITSGIFDVSLGGTGLDGTIASNGQLLIGNGSGYALGNLISADSSIIITNGAGMIDLASSLGTSVDISTETNLTVGGSLLSLSGDNISLREGTLVDGRICTYSSVSGLVCDIVVGAGTHSPVTIGSPANGLSVDGNQVLTLAQASATTAGALSSADWNTFNNKVSSQWVTTGSDIYYLTGNVGIGTASPSEKLEVSGNIKTTGNILASNNSQNVGSTLQRFNYGYFENLDVMNMSVGGLDISGSIANTFTINSNNTTNDLEDSFLAFDRGENGGSSNPAASLQWDSANDIFRFNFPLDVSNISTTGINMGGEAVTDLTGDGIIISGGALTSTLGTSIDISDETNLATAGNLLVITDDTLSVKEGTLTAGRLCSYDSTLGLVCNTDSTTVGHSALTVGAPANGLSVNGSQVLTLAQASTTTTGALSSADWNTFNNKQNALSGDSEIVLTGDSLSIAASIARDSELHSAVTVSGQGYLSLVGQAITASQINLASNVTGTLPIANGGTGATSLDNLITLGTHTTGNYVSTITGNSQIVVGGVGSENSTATLSIGADSIGDTQLAFNTGQDLTSASSPTFAGLTLNGNQTISGTLGIRESVGATYYTYFQGADQIANVTYTLPTGAPASDGYVLTSAANGTMSWQSVSGTGGTTGTGAVDQVAYWTGTSSLAGENQLNVSRGGTGVDGSFVTNGQILIGNDTANNFSLANITQGDGITVTNGAGSISVSSTLGTSIDISSETNLTGDTEIVLTGDSLSIAASIARDSELHSVVTLGTANGLSLSTQQLSLAVANTTTTGALTNTDWNTFNNKQNALTLGNVSGTANQITIAGGTGAVIGSGVSLSLPQDIHSGATPTFSGLTLNGNQTISGTLGIREGGTTPTYYTNFAGGDQIGNITYTLPTGAPAGSNYVLTAQADGTMSWASVSGVGGMNSFSLAADSGTTQTISNAETISILGGNNINSTVDGSNNVTLNLDSTLTGTTWNGNDIDISDYTNLSGNTEIVLTGDSLSIAASIARDSELHSTVTLSGQSYLSLVGQAITASQINLASNVTGTLPIANGGTGATSLDNLITLGTHTTGNYVSTITGNSQIVVGGVGSENSTATLSIGADSIGDTQLAFNTGQDLTSASSPTFNGLTLSGNQTINGTLAIREGGTTPTYYTTFQGGDQTGNITYTLPVASGAGGNVLKTDVSGNLYWGAVEGGSGGIGTVTSVVSGNGLTGGPITETGTLSINLLSANTDSATVSSYSGMEFVGGQLSIIRGCSANEVMGWDDTNGVWKCTSVSGVGGVTGSGSAGHMTYWSGTSGLTYDTNGNFFWDATNNRLGIGTASPATALDVNGTITTTGLILNGNQTLNGTLSIRENGATPTYYTIFQGGDQTGNITYTLPATNANGILKNTAGTLSWDTNTYLTANQTITLTGDVSGSGITSIATAVADDSHNHSSTTLPATISYLGSQIDISSETNLTGDSEIVLTEDSLSIAASIARDSELHSAVTVSGQSYLSLVGQAITASQINLASHVTGTLPIANGGTGATTLNDLITLGTHTTGNYVGTITGNSQIIVGGVGSENSTATLSIGADSIGDTQLTFNTGQHLTSTSTPTFAGLTLNGNQTVNGTLAIRETDGTPSYYTTFVGGDQLGNVTYTLPTGTPIANNYVLTAQTDGTMSWQSVSGVGAFNSFALSADSGTNQTINDSNTLLIAGGANLNSVVSTTDTVTLNLDSTLTGTTWNGTDIDISDYTNLTGDTEIVLTGDSLSIAASIARDSELHNAVTLGTANGLSLSTQQLSLAVANTTTIGALSSTDWNTFNNKVSSQWTTSGSNIYYNGGNVGVGTITPLSLLHLGGTPGTLASGLAFGDGDTGFYENADDQLYISLAGSAVARFGSNGNTLDSNALNGFALRSGNASATSPVYSINNDSNTGIGWAGVDTLSLIAGGINGLNVYATGGVANIGIGDTTPASLFTVGSGDLFQINASGQVVAGTWNGTDIDISDYTNLAVSGSLLNLTGDTLSVKAGTLSQGKICTYDSTLGLVCDTDAGTVGHETLTLGTANGLTLAGQQLSLGLASTSTTGALSSTDWNTFNNKFTLPALTSGSILFSNGATISQDNSNFFWDDVNNRLGLGTSTPTEALTVRGDFSITPTVTSGSSTQTTTADFGGGINTDIVIDNDNLSLSQNITVTGVGTTAHDITTTANDARSVYAIDVDSDGDVDVLSASSGDNRIAWYENNGSESFTLRTITIEAYDARSVYAIDVDSDGDIDVLSASYSWDEIVWYENNGSESFTPHTISTAANGARMVYAIDVDSDGDIDVLSASELDDKIAWYENNGSESFTPHTISTAADEAADVYAIDVDKDGDIDVLSASQGDDKVVWYENDGSESFTPHTISIEGDGVQSVYAIDIDSDGDIDVLSGSLYDYEISWYENNGSESFATHVISTSAQGPKSVYAIDADSDGDIDVLSASQIDNKIAWFRNSGSESFTPITITTALNTTSDVFAIDVDSDGDIDVLSSSRIDSRIAWYETASTSNGYNTTGTFISSTIDTGYLANFTTLQFNITEPVNTNIQFQLRSASTEGGLTSATWYGPTGTTDYHETTAMAVNSALDNNRYIQVKAILSTSDTAVTPVINDFTINYEAITSGGFLADQYGNVGIGDTTPVSLFTVGSGDLFQINSSGQVVAGTWNGTDIDISDYSNLAVSGSLLNLTGDTLSVNTGTLTNGRICTFVTGTGLVCDTDSSTLGHDALTLGTSNGLSLIGQQLSLGLASTSTTGALSSTDWNTFNNKFTLPTLTSGSILFSNGTTIAQDNSNFFWDDVNNRLGVGINNPSGKLHIVAGSGEDLYSDKYSNDGASPAIVGRKARGTSGSPLAVQAEDSLYALAGRGYDGSSFGVTQARINIKAAQNWSSTAKGTQLEFDTTPNNSTTTYTRLFIDNSGNIGISDTTPASLFTVGSGDLFQINASGQVVAGTWNGADIDVSDYTNLAVSGSLLNLTGDTLSVNAGTLTNGRICTFVTGTGLVCDTDASTLGHEALTLGTANGLSLTGQQLSLSLASTSTTGALSSTDWNTFNNKFTLPALTSGSILFSNGTTIAQDNGNFFWDDVSNRLGIGTSTPSNILSFGNSQNQKIGIENSDNLTDGRNLTIAAGSTINSGTSIDFTALSQPSNQWLGMTGAPNGDIYASANGGDIYEQTGGSGAFVSLSQTFRAWRGMAAAPNGDVYVAVANGDIYKQTNGTGNFIALSQTFRAWRGMAATPNGDVYAAVLGGDIYKQTGGTGNFVALGQTSRQWYGMTAAPNGDVYASVYGGDIYKQSGGSGDFLPLGQGTKNWAGITATPNGDVYASVYNGDIYKQTNGSGNFVALSQTVRTWESMAASPSGDVYAAAGGGDIYVQYANLGISNLAGGTLNLSSGAGKGTGESNISFLTGTPTISGTDMQALTEKMIITGSGNVGIGTSSPTAKLHLAAGLATVGGAPLKLTSGTNLTTPEAGAFEFDGTNLYFTDSTLTRKTISTGTAQDLVTLTNSPATYDYLTISGQAITLNQINLTTDVTGTLPVANGGTGTSTAFTSGSMIFAGAGGIYSQDNAKLSWDDTNNRLGIGTASPSALLNVKQTSDDIYGGLSILSQDGTSRAMWINAFNDTSARINSGVDGTGNLIINSGGGNVGIGVTNPSNKLHVTGSSIPGLFERTGSATNTFGSGLIVGYTSSGDITDGFGTGVRFDIEDNAGVSNPIAVVGAVRDGADNSGALSLWTYSAGVGNEKMRISPNGNVGIGDATPTSLFTVGNGDLFQINSSGQVVAGTWQGIAIGAAYGGTGLTSYGTANQIMGMNAAGTALEYKTVNGTTNQITVTNAANSLTLSLPQNIHTAATPTFSGLTLSGLTPGSIAFAGTGGLLSQDNVNFYWDDTNNRLGLGTATPSYQLDIAGAGGITDLFRVSSNGSDIMTVTDSQTTFSNPVTFGSVGDVSMAYDLLMTNSTAASIKFQGPGYVLTDSAWQNLDLTLSAANDGQVIVADTLLNDLDLSTVTAGSYYGTNIDVDSTGIFTTGTTNIYGVNSNATSSGISTGGTINTFGGYFQATGENTGAATTNAYGLYVNGATGADNNYSAVFMNGNVGIGTTNPSTKLSINQSADQNGLRIYGYDDKVTSYFDIAINGGGNTVLSTANGGLYYNSDVAMFDSKYQAFGANYQTYSQGYDGDGDYFRLRSNYTEGAYPASSISGDVFRVYDGTDDLIIPTGNVGIGDTTPDHKLDIAGNLGLDASSYINFGDTDGATGYGFRDNAGTMEFKNSAGAWTALGEGGASTFLELTDTPSSYTNGSILFTSGSAVTQDNANFFWDDTNNRLGLGTTTPGAMLDIFGASNKLRLSYDGSNYSELYVDSSGNLTMQHSGSTESALMIGSGLTQDVSIQFDGNTTDYYSGVDYTSGLYMIGSGLTVGTNPYLSVDSTGKIGIGTLSQTALLHLNGTNGTIPFEINSNQAGTNNILMLRSDNPTADNAVFRVDATGATYSDGSYSSAGADYAEYFLTSDKDLMAGEVVCVDENNSNSVKRCSRSGDTNIMGIVSSNPSIIGNGIDGRENDENYKVIGMLGQIPAKVNDESGSINIGDSLTSSSTAGYLRKAEAGEPTVGLALEKLVSGKSTIAVMISRRNKSLTVETVEQSIQDRIAQMEIEDQVNQIIANGSEILEVKSRLNSLELASMGNGLLMTDIQTQMNQIKEQIKEVDFAQMDDKLDTLLSFLDATDGNITINGKLEAEITETGALVIKNTDEEAPIIGTGKICGLIADSKDENGEYDNIDDCSGNKIPFDKDEDGMNDWTNNTEPMPKDEDHNWINDETNDPIINNAKRVTIYTKAVKKNSKIFVTSTSQAIIQPLAVISMQEGESFTVETNDGIKVDSALEFNWWIVEEGE